MGGVVGGVSGRCGTTAGVVGTTTSSCASGGITCIAVGAPGIGAICTEASAGMPPYHCGSEGIGTYDTSGIG